MEGPDKSNKSGKPPVGERFQPKVLLIWFMIFMGIVWLWTIQGNREGGRITLPMVIVTDAAKADVFNGNQNGRLESAGGRGEDWHQVSGYINPEYLAEKDVSFRLPKDEANPRGIAFHAEGKLTDENYDLLRQYFQEKPASTWMMTLIVNLLPFILIVGLLYFLFVRQLKMAGRGALSFGKSKARMLTREKDRVTFKDVAGCEEAKEEVHEVVDFLKDPQKFQRIGARIPKGILMVGPPGTGKTLIARAVAGEAEVPFFTISGSDFVEMFVGVGAARVRDMFEQGRKSAPCLIFIDEIDAVGRQRGAGLGGGNDEREQTLNSLLVEMDGFEGHEGIIIIAATNRPDVLDKALLRPGRFDRQVIIDLPDLNGREEILKIHAKKVKLHDSVDLLLVARNSPGFSGADLANLLNESALTAARHNKTKIHPEDIDEAREKISFGRERRKLMDDEDKRITAYHEAGHAIVQAVIDDGYLPVHKVTIIPRGHSLGSTMFAPTKDMLSYAKKRILNQICCAMGGRIAEDLKMGDITSGASGDIKMATKLARSMVCDWGMSALGPVAYGDNQDHVFLGKEIARDQNYSEETALRIDAEIRGIVDEQYKRSTKILTDNDDALETLAQSLLEFETLEGKHVQEILETGKIQSDVIPVGPLQNKEDINEEDASDLEEDISGEEEDLGPGPSPAGAPA
ncbi:MAG: ATP-dependent zinc metalloprotease FtsH [Opitutae bacterium]|nr:ATP-dependent zinc metalloprotease FtsH [Opitutae bacterium]